MIFAGVDAGSRAIKVVLVQTDGVRPLGLCVGGLTPLAGAQRGQTPECAENGSDPVRVLACACADQGVQQGQLARELFERVLGQRGLSRADVAGVVATGYARNLVEFADTTITEITCHARGVHHLCPAARTVVEIGGQDSKLLRLEETGAVRDFAMNDRCAAGTGRFLEMVATRLNVPLSELGGLAAKATSPAIISSMCAVFAETEIIGLLAGGSAVADIVAGVQVSVAQRVAAMAGRRVAEPVMLTGGVALVGGMTAALTSALGAEVTVVPDPQFTGALVAALLAHRAIASNCSVGGSATFIFITEHACASSCATVG